MAWFAETIVEGFVPSVAGAVQMTRSAVQNAVLTMQANLLAQQTAAFGRGGHQLHGGHAWTKLKPRTVEMKSKLGVARPAAPLFRTGSMSKRQRVRIRLKTLANGIGFQIHASNTAWYSRFHQSGYRHVWSGEMVPARMPVEITEQDLAYVTESIRSYMAGGTAVARKQKKSLKAGVKSKPRLGGAKLRKLLRK